MVALIFCHNRSTRYAAFFQPSQTPDSVITHSSVAHCPTADPGFTFTLATGTLPDGSHSVDIRARNQAGLTVSLGTRTIDIQKKTCLVLSVGEVRGLAHLGAVEAVKEHGIDIDCVFGTSMGAVVGGLYATAPDSDLKLRYKEFSGRYIESTESEASGLLGLGALIGTVLTGGIGGLVFGGLAGAASVDELDIDRFRETLDQVFSGVEIEDLPLQFGTSYQTLDAGGVEYVVATTGNLADAVSKSANNLFLFGGDLQSAQAIDPGTDRLARVPVDDACRIFQPARIIAINVTGTTYLSSPDMNCGVEEIMIDVDDTGPEALEGDGAAFELVYLIGYETTRSRMSEIDP